MAHPCLQDLRHAARRANADEYWGLTGFTFLVRTRAEGGATRIEAWQQSGFESRPSPVGSRVEDGGGEAVIAAGVLKADAEPESAIPVGRGPLV